MQGRLLPLAAAHFVLLGAGGRVTWAEAQSTIARLERQLRDARAAFVRYGDHSARCNRRRCEGSGVECVCGFAATFSTISEVAA